MIINGQGKCTLCGGTYAFDIMAIAHAKTCPHYCDNRVQALAAATPLAEAEGAQQNETDGAEATMAPEGPRVASMDLARFKRTGTPAGSSPRSALEAAMEWIDDPETDAPTHIIVLVGRDAPDGGSMTRYFQAGAYRHHAQMGLCLEAMHMIRESGS